MNSVNINEENTQNWLALIIGNSHLHWAWFETVTRDRTILKQNWDTPHGSASGVACLIRHDFDFNQCGQELGFVVESPIDRPINSPSFPKMLAPIPLWIASVVPAQTQLWQSYANAHVLDLDQIPLQGIYPTMGIDRALALWGAVNRLALPVLVIDAGTALTFTGADATGQFVGGAILPGLGLQIRSLTEHTAALPPLFDRLEQLRSIGSVPQPWAINTPDAMLSGILHTLLAGIDCFIQDWMQNYPNSTIVFTGGDGELLLHHWQYRYPERSWPIKAEPNLGFWGMQSVAAQRTL